MGKIKQDFRYKKLEEFLTNEEIQLLETYTLLIQRINREKFDKTEFLNTADSSFYGDPVTDALLLCKQKTVEKEVGRLLLPTYSFWRVYTHGAVLKTHTDRPSCEISLTVNIGGDKEWPFLVQGKEIILHPGEALVYLGTELNHGRKAYSGDWQSQVFLHYVSAEGRYKKDYKDRREFFGIKGGKSEV